MAIPIPYTVEAHPETGVYNGKLGVWLFLASEVMLFGALFSSYILLRTGAEHWPHGVEEMLNVPLATFNTLVLIASSVTMVLAWAAVRLNNFKRFRLYMGSTFLCGFDLPGRQVHRVLAQVPHRPLPEHEQLPGDLLHAHRPARPARHRRHGRQRLSLGPGRQALPHPRRRGSRTASRWPGCTGTSSTWSGSSSSPCSICCRGGRDARGHTRSHPQGDAGLHPGVRGAGGPHRGHGGV